MASLTEPAREIPIVGEFDVCVVGGSCTGVFAALRAARLGASVAVVERAGAFGGTATQSLVNVWHSPLDEAFERTIIGGLTVETMERLTKRDAVVQRARSAAWAWAFNPFELQIELDEMVREAGVRPFLHTLCALPIVEDGKLTAVAIEDKSGRRAIRARAFVDATGDGDLCRRLGLETYMSERNQPSTTCATLAGWPQGVDVGALVREHGPAANLPAGFMWGAQVPGSEVFMLAGTRVAGIDCATGEGLTEAEMEGRRQVRAIMDIVRRHVSDAKPTLQALPARIGIRETRHVRCRHQLSGDDVLTGRRFDDAIANGSYRVDIHHTEKPGITLRYLDGREQYLRPGHAAVEGRWREATAESPTFYQVPLRALVPAGPYENLIVAGRMLDADSVAHAAVRVMVNANQTGEAAGVAAQLCAASGRGMPSIPAAEVREVLARGGSVVI